MQMLINLINITNVSKLTERLNICIQLAKINWVNNCKYSRMAKLRIQRVISTNILHSIGNSQHLLSICKKWQFIKRAQRAFRMKLFPIQPMCMPNAQYSGISEVTWKVQRSWISLTPAGNRQNYFYSLRGTESEELFLKILGMLWMQFN